MPDQDSSRLAAKANQLYWNTSRPAGHLADELGISRSKFYALIEPLRLEVMCQTCGAPIAFSSRSDREAGRGRCPDCGAVMQVSVAAAADAAPASRPTPAPTAAAPDGGPGPVSVPINRVLWVSAMAGTALGLLFTAWWRRR